MIEPTPHLLKTLSAVLSAPAPVSSSPAARVGVRERGLHHALSQVRNAAPLPPQMDLDSMRQFVRLVDRCVAELNAAQRLQEPVASVVWATAVSGSLPVMMLCRHGEPELAAQRLFFLWKAALVAVAGVPEREWQFGIRDHDRVARIAMQEQMEACLPGYALAVSELVADKVANESVRVALERLRVHLAIDVSELARAFGVTSETVEAWLHASARAPVPPELRGKVMHAVGALDRLLGLFKPESLAQAVRRRAGLFDGKRALDWILAGRIAEVADRYDVALSYQA